MEALAALLALTALGIAQPLLDLLGRQPEFFVARGMSGVGLVALPAAVWLLPPLVLAAFVVAISLAAHALAGPRGESWMARRTLEAAVAAAALPLALVSLRQLTLAAPKTSALPGFAVVVLAVALAAGVAAAWRRWRWVRAFLSLLAVLSLAVPAMFLARAPVRALSVPTPYSAIDVAQGKAVAPGLPAPVVVLIFDELPAASLLGADGEIDAGHFPHFASLAARSMSFDRATTVATLTLQAVPAILTGRYPRPNELATAADHPESLFTLLAESHRCLAFEPRTAIGPSALCSDLSDGGGLRDTPQRLAADLAVVWLHLAIPAQLAAQLPDISTAWGGFTGLTALADPASQVRRFLTRLDLSLRRGDDRPPLVVLHALVPHHPWIYLPSGERYHPGPEIFIDGLQKGLGAATGHWVEDPWTVAQAHQRHLLQLQHTDALLGEILHLLEDHGLFEPALVVVTADHGISFRPGGPARRLDEHNYPEVAAVPLLVKLPHQREPRRSSRPVELVDLVPTVAETLKAPLPWAVDGHSLLSGPAEPRDRRFLYQDADHQVWLFDLALPGIEAAVAAKLARFAPAPGGGPDPWRPRTPGDGLLGKPAAGLVAAAPAEDGAGVAPITAILEDPQALRRLDPGSGWLPSRIRVQIEPADPDNGRWYALAVDGIVRAISRPRGNSGEISFLVPASTFSSAPPVVELYLLDVDSQAPATPGTPALVPVPLPPLQGYHLRPKARAGELVVEADDGNRYQLDPGRFEGEVFDAVLAERAYRAELIGWARERASGKPAGKILVFADGELKLSGIPNLDRPELSRRYLLPGREGAGFVFSLPIEALSGEVRIYALSTDGAATRIPYQRRLEPVEEP